MVVTLPSGKKKKLSKHFGVGKGFYDDSKDVHIRYLFVCKVHQQRNYTTSFWGKRMYSKVYGIAYLTDEGEYSVTEFHARGHSLTDKIADRLERIITTDHKLDKNTEVVLTGNFEENDIVLLFLHIMHVTNRMTLFHVTDLKMCKAINRELEYVKTKKFNHMHKNKLFNKMLELKRFEYCPDDFGFRLSMMSESRKKLHKLCALGMYYMYIKQKRRARLKSWYDRHPGYNDDYQEKYKEVKKKRRLEKRLQREQEKLQRQQEFKEG